jgi:hypothetical protein
MMHACCVLGRQDWRAAREALAAIGAQETAAGQLGCIVHAEQAIMKTVMSHNDAEKKRYAELLERHYRQQVQGSGADGGGSSAGDLGADGYWTPPKEPAPLVVGGDELTPLFLYHLRDISIQTGIILNWLRFTYVFENRSAE